MIEDTASGSDVGSPSQLDPRHLPQDWKNVAPGSEIEETDPQPPNRPETTTAGTPAACRPTGTIPAGEPRQIQLASGEWFTVDAEDFERVNSLRWHAKRARLDPSRIYPAHDVREPGKGRNSPKRAVMLHRWLVGAKPGEVVDHRDGNTLNNTRANLRITDARGNSTNVTSSKRQKAGGYKGVSWNKNAGKWEANIAGGEVQPNGKRRKLYLGLFTDPVVAAKAYDAAARHYFGEYAACNFPPEPVEFIPAANAAEKESA